MICVKYLKLEMVSLTRMRAMEIVSIPSAMPQQMSNWRIKSLSGKYVNFAQHVQYMYM